MENNKSHVMIYFNFFNRKLNVITVKIVIHSIEDKMDNHINKRTLNNKKNKGKV